jgi:ABC-2 type transport system permease protein
VRKIAALARASWLDAASYRMNMAFSLVTLVASLVPFYFIANALQPLMAKSIAGQGEHYFAFLVVGMVAFGYLRIAINALPSAIGSAISNGTFEAMLGTPTRLSTMMAGMVAYPFLWTTLRAAIVVMVAAALGAELLWSRSVLAVLILLLIVAAHFAVGLFAGALILAFRTAGPLGNAVILLSTALGGVYYPTDVIPEGLRQFAEYLPLAYGLRALRRAVLEPDLSLSTLGGDVGPLVASVIILNAVAVVVFLLGLRYARRAGTLSQY